MTGKLIMRAKLWIALGAISLIAAGCPNQQQAVLPDVDAIIGPQAWIDAPLDGMTIPLASYEVVAHASSSNGVASFEFSVNGIVENPTIVNPGQVGQMLAYFMYEWTPPAPGTYLLSVRGFDSNGEPGPSAEARVVVEGEVPAEEPEEEPTPTPTPRDEADDVEEPTPTETPETPAPDAPTATSTFTSVPPTITPTPTNTFTPTPSLPTIVSFTANPPQIGPGGASTLTCEITGATNADIFGNPVDPTACNFPVFPSETTDYVLRACSTTEDESCIFAIVNVIVLAPTDTPVRPQCSDGLDNDGDGLIDFNLDRECDSANDDDESN